MAGKRVLVLSDSDLLFEVIEANLKQIHVQADRLGTVTKTTPSDGNVEHPCGPGSLQPQRCLEKAEANDCDLIVVAISSSNREPLVALFNAALTEHVGRVPLLIISDRGFDACQEGRIFHLDFPFDSAELRYKIQALLAC